MADPDKNPVIRLFKRFVPVTPQIAVSVVLSLLFPRRGAPGGRAAA